jgi:hypothetical protein
VPREYSFTLAHGQPVLLFTITRVDGTVERITNASKDITISAATWARHGGLKAGFRTSRNDGTPPTLGFQVQLGASSPLRFRDVDRGKYERARVQVYVTNQANPVTADFEFDGEIRGNVSYDPFGLAQFDLMSRFAIPRDIFVPNFTLLCRHSFGDPLTCKVPTFPYLFGGDLDDVARSTAYALGARRRVRFDNDLTPEDYRNVYLEVTTAGTTAGSAPSFSSTVGATTTDGSVVWTTRNAWARWAQVAAATSQTLTLTALPDPRASDSTWFRPNKIRFASGEYSGQVFKGGSWDPDEFTIQTYLPCPFVTVGDWLEIAPDCDKTHETCNTKFSNAANHGGFPFQLGAKYQSQQMGIS